LKKPEVLSASENLETEVQGETVNEAE
jgi:hypothetical protein